MIFFKNIKFIANTINIWFSCKIYEYLQIRCKNNIDWVCGNKFQVLEVCTGIYSLDRKQRPRLVSFYFLWFWLFFIHSTIVLSWYDYFPSFLKKKKTKKSEQKSKFPFSFWLFLFMYNQAGKNMFLSYTQNAQFILTLWKFIYCF